MASHVGKPSPDESALAPPGDCESQTARTPDSATMPPTDRSKCPRDQEEGDADAE